ncbi:transposase family protein [Streptomyces sp. NPDC051994]|uniref:helix-turn-helix domain-containing protein n=1 Tax=unclassified Streptomyces TaxID=2593676 RepID=UPI00343E6287
MIIRNQRITGLSPDLIAELVAEIGPLWHERHQAALVSRPRRRAVGAGAKHKLVFVDRLWATLIHLRHGATHDVLACWFAVDRCTITRAVGEVRPLLAERGCTIAPDIRLRTTPHIPSEGFARSCWGVLELPLALPQLGLALTQSSSAGSARGGGRTTRSRAISTTRRPKSAWDNKCSSAGATIASVQIPMTRW